jgi:hypothetical protein
MFAVSRSSRLGFRTMALLVGMTLGYICFLRANDDGSSYFEQFDGKNNQNGVFNSEKDSACESVGACMYLADGKTKMKTGDCYKRDSVCVRPPEKGGDVYCPHESADVNNNYGLCVNDVVKYKGNNCSKYDFFYCGRSKAFSDPKLCVDECCEWIYWRMGSCMP